MNFTENVYELSESFMKNPEYVFMEKDIIHKTADEMKKNGKLKFEIPEIVDDGYNVFRQAVVELVAASINYCYWYGKDDIRPNGASSTTMFNLLVKAFNDYIASDKIQSFNDSIEIMIEYLALNRFPLLEERAQHLRQLKDLAEEFTVGVYNDHSKISSHFTDLLRFFPGFASDMFLKRASLYFIQLYRCFGWFEEDMKNLHVPADYQVPKMLNNYGCIEYNEILYSAIWESQLIPKHSKYECEIRAATVLTIKMLCELTDWNVADVDSYFFLRRDTNTDPFHLTITTDY